MARRTWRVGVGRLPDSPSTQGEAPLREEPTVGRAPTASVMPKNLRGLGYSVRGRKLVNA